MAIGDVVSASTTSIPSGENTRLAASFPERASVTDSRRGPRLTKIDTTLPAGTRVPAAGEVPTT
jgi:hypothetical protein